MHVTCATAPMRRNISRFCSTTRTSSGWYEPHRATYLPSTNVDGYLLDRGKTSLVSFKKGGLPGFDYLWPCVNIGDLRLQIILFWAREPLDESSKCQIGEKEDVQSSRLLNLFCQETTVPEFWIYVEKVNLSSRGKYIGLIFETHYLPLTWLL